MKKLLAPFLLLILLTACTPQAIPSAAPTEVSPPSPTLTLSPTPTATIAPTPTTLPGTEILPIGEMGKDIPWLQPDGKDIPGSYFVFFNTQKPPFNNLLVRKAFAAAVDRNAIVAVAENYYILSPQPATTIIPSLVLGRDLYNEVGIPYDPLKAKAYFSEAGYSDPSTFPKLTFQVRYRILWGAPAHNQKLAEALAAMWRETLGVDIKVETFSTPNYNELLANDPSGLFLIGWVADVIDPDNFMGTMFRSNPQVKLGGFSNADLDRLINRATSGDNPADRQALYIQAERLLCEDYAAVIPLYYFIHRLP
jgi:oligopeptide transport system substrate-binding protein